ncbi:MAG TPA: hypothetical protein VHV08_16170, partial [Pirellulales bacterium]|nr:hypothetical protein [Pirellulales bacterium]
EDASLQGAWIDQRKLSVAPTRPPNSSFDIDLPFGRNLTTLTLYYSTSEGLPALTAMRSPPLAELDIPVMSLRWSVELPPDYEIPESGGTFPTASITPPSRLSRLFGNLGRNSAASVFNPFSTAAWQRQFRSRSDLQAVRATGDEFVQNLGIAMNEYLSGDAESELTWGQLLSLTSDSEQRAHRALLVDVESLAQLGLTPETRVRFQTGESARDRGLALLTQAGVVAIANPSGMVLTGPWRAASFARQLSMVEPSVMFASTEGPMADEVHRAAQPRARSRFVPVSVWREAPAEDPSPWMNQARTPESDEPFLWNRYAWEATPAGVPQIRIVHISTMNAVAWALFLATAALLMRGTQGRPLVPIVVISLSGAVALWSPAAFAPLASSIFVAGWLCLAWRLLQFKEPVFGQRTAARPGSRSKFAVFQQGATLLLVAISLHFCAELAAAPPIDAGQRAPAASLDAPAIAPESNLVAPAKDAEAPHGGQQVANAAKARVPAANLQQILVPIDGEQNLAGVNYYVPEKLYSQLYRLAAAANGRPQGWLITKAAYHGALSRDPVSKQLVLSQFKAIYDIQAFQDSAQVELPLARDTAADVVLAARLEGHPLAIRWNASGSSLIVGPVPAGDSRLELELQPVLQNDLASAGFELPVLPTSTATLTLAIPPDAPAIELPGARGQVRMNKDQGEITAQLGACSRLAVRWPVGLGMEASAPNLEVEELIWMKVRPGTTILDAKFKFRILAGSLRQIRLLADPRLRLLPSSNAQSSVTAVHTALGDPQRIDLEMARTVSDHAIVDLSFLVTGTSGVGNLWLPRIETAGARASKRWLAVSIDPSLQFKEQLGEDSVSLGVGDFITAWGAADARPQSAYSIPRGEAMWRLATQPIEPHTTVEQTLVCSVGRNASVVEIDAGLAIAGGYLFQFVLDAPPELTFDRISLLEEDQQRVARWATDDHGRSTVFLTAPVTGKQRLSVRGKLNAPARDAMVLPRIALVGASLKKTQWQLFRQPAVLVEAVPGPGISATKASESQRPDELGSQVGVYESEDPHANLQIKTAPNDPQTRAVAITTLERDADRWAAQVDYRVVASGGLIDTLQFEIPPQWSEPFRLEPQAPFKVVPIPGEARRQMIVYPDKPIDTEYRLRIRGRVALSPGDRLRVPDILPQQVQEIERFVVVPQYLDLQQVSWETLGLAHAQLPAEFAGHGQGSQSPAIYRVSGEHFQASIKAVRRSRALGQVKLADIHLAWEPSGHYQAVTLFDLDAPSTDTCVLEVPAGCRLLHVSIDNLPAQIVGLKANRWRVTLGPPQLPQRLEVIYSGPLVEYQGNQRFEAPRLVGLEVEKTLWTINSLPSFTIAAPSQNIAPVSSAKQSLTRLETIGALMQLPSEVIGEHLPEEILRWYRPWKRRYQESRKMFAAQLARFVQGGETSPEASEARRMDQQIEAVDARIGSANLGTRPVISAPEAWGLLLSSEHDWSPTYYQSLGQVAQIDVRVATSYSSDIPARVAGGLAIVALGVFAALALRMRKLPDVSPWIVVAVVGVAWWLLLAPSFVGLVLLAVALATAFRSRPKPLVRPIIH